MPQQHIIAAADQLAREGKKPTVALVKSRLSQPASMRNIIEVLKVWRFNPDTAVPADKVQSGAAEADSQSDTPSTEQLIAAAVTPLRQELAALRIELDALKQTFQAR
ncbi:MAG: hypothetical protein ACI86X_000742 [Moritella sp.]|jgi:hypothetical protein